ncbi:MAG: S-layer homology domain-containing protein [Eubacteriales bacterium]|nr:S-layer homology domain-containing protein [Eubacteriales bacterium]
MKKKRISALLLVAALAAATSVCAGAAEQAGYVVQGAAENGGLSVTVSVRGDTAYGGRLALCYDTDKLTLTGGDSLAAVAALNDSSFTGDHVEEDELINAAGGCVGFAWYGYGVKDGGIAKLRFAFASGASTDDLDGGSIRLRYVPDEGFGDWNSPAALRTKGSGVYLTTHAYLADGVDDLAVTFDYPGSAREPEAGRAVWISCRDAAGKPVAAKLEANGQSWTGGADGQIALRLQDGDYNYRATADGFGAQYGKLTVSGDTELPVVFVNDQTLVEQAAQQLQIGFAGTDTASRVTDTLGLPERTENGVAVSWKSSDTAVVSDSGLVYRPARDTKVTLTATLSHGAAHMEKTFTVTVRAKETGGGAPGGSGGSIPSVPEAQRRFTDLDSVPWARDAIELLAGEGVINGTSKTTFTPEAQIKRGDFLALVMRMAAPGAKADGQAFADVPAGSYYYKEITAARALGITNGVGGNAFAPELPITRQEMVTLTAQAADKLAYLPETGAAGDLTAFSDHGQIAGWAKQGMADMVGRGMLVGSGGQIRPQANTTRAEAAVFLCRVYLSHQP